MHKIADSLGPALCLALPCIHALTGCDMVSFFFGIGKKTVLSSAQALAKSSSQCIGALGNGATLDASRQFVVALYDLKFKFKGSHDSLNKLQYRLASKQNVQVAKLPPSEASFDEEHVQ